MKNKPMIQMNSHQLQVVKSAFLSESFTQHPSQYCTSPTKSNLNKPEKLVMPIALLSEKKYIYTKFEGETVRGANRKTLTREM